MFKQKKAVAVVTFIFAVVILVGLFFTLNPVQQAVTAEAPDEENTNTVTASVTVDDVTDNASEAQKNEAATPAPIIDVPTITPPIVELPPDVPEDAEHEQNPNEIQLTQIEERPAPPDLPTTAFPGEREDDEYATLDDVEAHQALDPALTNPNVRPNLPAPTPPPPATPAPTPAPTPTPPNNAVYVPGFGWIESSGPNDVQESGSDGDWDKQIGNMG